MAIEVFPTANDIGGAGTGRSSTEESIAQVLGLGVGETTIISGFTAAVGAGLNVYLAPGRASIGGYIIRNPDFLNVPVTDETTGYLWLQLAGADTYDATGTAWVETADLSSPPANAALVTKFITSGGAISSVVDRERREGEGMFTGSYAGDGGADEEQEIDIGLTPRLVVAKARLFEANSRCNFAISNIFPGNVEWDNFDETLKGLPWWQMYFSEGIVPPSEGNQAAGWNSEADDTGGLGIIPDGFAAYNDDGSTTRGMNRSGVDYDYIAWF